MRCGAKGKYMRDERKVHAVRGERKVDAGRKESIYGEKGKCGEKMQGKAR
jgi:hypothetical protein